jgi:hypothetical protein
MARSTSVAIKKALDRFVPDESPNPPRRLKMTEMAQEFAALKTMLDDGNITAEMYAAFHNELTVQNAPKLPEPPVPMPGQAQAPPERPPGARRPAATSNTMGKAPKRSRT